MRTLSLTILALTLSLFVSAQKPATIPEVAAYEAASGQTTLNGTVKAKGKALANIAAQLQSDLALTVAAPQKSGATITLSIKADKTANPESYTIRTTEKSVEITAPTPEGVRWGTQTLLQMLSADGTVAQGTINDEPQYPLRGFMIDCGRKFYPIDYLRGLIRTMSYYKMNALQVHLNDNGFNYWHSGDWNKTQAAFRMQSDFFPGLTATDGSYSKQEMRDLIRYAAELGVEIIPEIDVPAHSLAFTRYRPSLAKPEFGMDHLNITDPKVVEFIDSLFIEYCSGEDPVFCCPKVHIGTDEFNNSKPEYREAFRALSDRLIRLVESYGKQALLWGSLSHAYGQTPVKSENVLMSLWNNGFANPKDMKEAGFKMISIPDGYVYIVPAAGYYYDYLNCKWLFADWTPAHIGGTVFEEQDPAVAGGMFAIWNDHPGNGITVQDCHDRIFPAMQVIAEKTWAAKKVTRTWEQYDQAAQNLGEGPGIDQLGRATKSYAADELKAGAETGQVEKGYPYEATFTIECKPEQRGTVLLEGPHSTFYLSDPLNGRVGFEREGYVHQFNYTLPAEGTVTLSIKADNNSTTLFVNGQKKQRLEREAMYVLGNPRDHAKTLPGSNAIVADATTPVRTMYYMHTLFFPLQKAGNYKSRVTSFSIK